MNNPFIQQGKKKPVVIQLPTLHVDQEKVYNELIRDNRFVAVRCGRRWGKTELGKTIICDDVAHGLNTGWFTPDYKIQAEAYAENTEILAPIIKSSSETKGVVRTWTGGRIDYWTLENQRAGRSRKYHRVLIDEAAFTKKGMMDIWKKSIMPTLLDYKGSALVLSNTNGTDPENFFYQICNDPQFGFKQYHAPTSANPYMPPEEIERLRATEHPLVFAQEYEAEFIDWMGVKFFAKADMLDAQGEPYPYPARCDGVIAIIDTAVKTGKENDATAVSYWAICKVGFPQPYMICLDWDIQQIEGALLEKWLPSVFENLERFAKECNARNGSLGAHIEDKVSGSVLLQQARNRKWPAHPISTILTSWGKDERAISVSGYVYQRKVRLSSHAFHKVTTYKKTTRNHFLHQVCDFRIGIDDQEDDLLDTYCYAISLTFGDAKGF